MAGHMNKHPDVEFVRLSVRLPREKVEKFKEFCRRHKTTTCALVNALLTAVEKGDELGVVDLAASNPVIVQLQEFYASRPRGHGKYDVSHNVAEYGVTPQVYCVFCGGFSGSLVFCQRYGSNWLPSARCVECPSNWFKKKGEV